MEKKDLIKKLNGLSDDVLIEVFKKSHGSRDEYTVDRKPNGSIFIRWSNDNGFRETASGTDTIFSSKTEQIDINYLPYLISNPH